MKYVVKTLDAPTPGGAYSHGVVWNGLLFTAGMGPIDPTSGSVVGTSIQEQTHQVMKNLGAVLRASGMDYSQVLKATVHLASLQEDFKGFNEVYRSYFGENDLPVRTTVGSTLNGILVEIDFVAGATS